MPDCGSSLEEIVVKWGQWCQEFGRNLRNLGEACPEGLYKWLTINDDCIVY